VNPRLHGTALIAALLVACRSGPPALRASLDSLTPDSVGTYDSAAVANAWRSIDSGVLAQLSADHDVGSIQRWLTSVENFSPPDTSPLGPLPTLIAVGAPPFGFGNAIGALGVGSGRDSTLVVVVGWGGFGGPSHLALFRRRDGTWLRSFSYASDRKLWLQGRPLDGGAGWVLATETAVTDAGSQTRLRAWRAEEGGFIPLAFEDTSVLSSADFVSPPSGFAIESPERIRALGSGGALVLREERRLFTLDGDTVRTTINSLDPWLVVVDDYFEATARGRSREAAGSLADAALARTLRMPGPKIRAAHGDTLLGWGLVDLHGGTDARPIDVRVLVQRSRSGAWRITKAAIGHEVAGIPLFPALTP
jgi:hypothetical protein